MASTETIKLSVKVMGGDTIDLDVNPTDSIEAIKAEIEKLQGTPAHQQKLTFRGKPLQDGNIAQYNIKKKAMLLLIKNPGAIEPPKQEDGEQVLCVTGCGFWGNTATESKCSKCYEEGRKALADAPKSAPTPEASSSTPAVDIEMKDADPSGDDLPPISGSPPAQKNPTRCYKCNRRVGYTIIKCRCGFGFCGKHRYSDQHDCPYDYKATQQAILSKANQKVQADKIENRLT